MMDKTFRAVVIDPERRSIEEVRVPAVDTMTTVRALIPRDEDERLDHFLLAEHDRSWDQGWVRDCGLANGAPIHALKLRGRQDPVAGRIVIVGVDRETRETCDARISLGLMWQIVEWLGLIKPEVTWVKEATGSRAVVTYSRVTHDA